MDIAIIEEFSRIGGGQVFAGMISEMLAEEGIDVTLITDKNHHFLRGEYKRIIETDFTYSEDENPLSTISKMIRLKNKLRKTGPFDFVINNHPNVFLYRGDVNSLHSISIVEQALDENGDISNRFVLLSLKLARLYRIYDNASFWVSTEYNRMISRKVFERMGVRNTKFYVSYIPVKNMPDVNLDEKKDQVLVFGRISREKSLDAVIDIAKKIDLKFIIAGSVNPGNEKYYHELVSSLPGNVEVIPNPDEELKDRLYRDSRIFLHLRKRESFGISVADAISYGCVPVVPKSGGPWTDIVQEGKFGMGFSNNDEAVECLRRARNFTDSEVRSILNSRDRFSYQKFKNEYMKMIESIIEKR